VAANGVITTVAGNGTAGFGGDGDAATGASLNQPRDVAAIPHGSFLVADTGNNRIRLVTTSGLTFTVAGGAAAGFAGDRGAATVALVSAPSSIAPIIGGGYLIADTGNNRIRRVDTTARSPPSPAPARPARRATVGLRPPPSSTSPRAWRSRPTAPCSSATPATTRSTPRAP
jgi:hypothetical protein